MRQPTNRKLFQMAQFNRDESKRLDALNELISRFIQQSESKEKKIPHKKPIEISDFATVCRNTKSEATAMFFLESLHKNSLMDLEACRYVIVYGCTEKVSLRAFEILIAISEPSTKTIRRFSKFVPLERSKLRSMIQEYIIAHNEANEDDYRFLAERAETESLATRSLELLIKKSKFPNSHLGRVYRSGIHPEVKKIARQHLHRLTQQA